MQITLHSKLKIVVVLGRFNGKQQNVNVWLPLLKKFFGGEISYIFSFEDTFLDWYAAPTYEDVIVECSDSELVM